MQIEHLSEVPKCFRLSKVGFPEITLSTKQKK